MKKIIVVILIYIFISVLTSSCSPTIETLEVTRIIPQTVIATRLITQIVLVNVTSTPQPTGIASPTLTPSPRWTPASTTTPLSLKMLTLTPGLQVIDNTTQPEIEKIISADYIREFLVMNYGEQSFGGKVLCGYTPMGMANDGHTIKLYVFASCIEYYLREQEIKTGTAMDMPVVLFVELRSGYKIVNYLDAGVGYQYVKTNFPPEIQKVIGRSTAPDLFNNKVLEVKQGLRKEAESVFGK